MEILFGVMFWAKSEAGAGGREAEDEEAKEAGVKRRK